MGNTKQPTVAALYAAFSSAFPQNYMLKIGYRDISKSIQRILSKI